MDAWVTLVAAVAGAGIAIFGQQITKRGESNARLAELLLEQCSQVLALSEDFRNRLWEERELGLPGRVDGWDLGQFRLAAARLRILCGDQHVLRALDELNSSGKALGAYWRRKNIDAGELDALYERAKLAAEAFATASANLFRQRIREG
ncbi:hypothetical protein [Micromonospora sp. NPDC005161]